MFSFMKHPWHAQKTEDKYSSLFDNRNDDVGDIPDSMEALMEEARSKQYDMPTLLRRMRSMVRSNPRPWVVWRESGVEVTLMRLLWCELRELKFCGCVGREQRGEGPRGEAAGGPVQALCEQRGAEGPALPGAEADGGVLEQRARSAGPAVAGPGAAADGQQPASPGGGDGQRVGGGGGGELDDPERPGAGEDSVPRDHGQEDACGDACVVRAEPSGAGDRGGEGDTPVRVADAGQRAGAGGDGELAGHKVLLPWGPCGGDEHQPVFADDAGIDPAGSVSEVHLDHEPPADLPARREYWMRLVWCLLWGQCGYVWWAWQAAETVLCVM